mmetsp:Transcript_17824/g.60814  ORF Transcript_17824/g.60814 Transcript_17824/m.60814 type:complete len:200 (+) Transcript_17824:124-723(+)
MNDRSAIQASKLHQQSFGNHMHRKFLHGNKIKLRPVEETDASVLKSIFDDVGWTASASYTPRSINSWQKVIAGYQAVAAHEPRFLICVSNEPVGMVDLFHTDWRNGVANYGIVVSSGYHRKGYGSEAIKLLFDYAFLHLNLRKLFAEVLGFNTASISLMEKLKCKLEATISEKIIQNGKAYPVLVFSMTKEKWVAEHAH